MNSGPTASIIVNNFNYARFLAAAIDSALNQTYSNTEVIIVDDGSTDESRDVIERYRGRVVEVFKPNGGQGSAFNAGFDAASGEILLFLDADDMLLAHAVTEVLALFDAPDVVKVHWPLRVIDAEGRISAKTRPAGALPHGDLRETAFRLGPTNHLSPPTSGNAWSRAYLEQILPVPERVYRTAADTYLFELAPFFGSVRKSIGPLGLYRIHDRNGFRTRPLEEKLELELGFYENCCDVLAKHFDCARDPALRQRWREQSWWHRLQRALLDIANLPVTGGPMILVDAGTWDSGPVAGRERLPFPQRDGVSWGNPQDDEAAITELERLRRAGADLIVIVWAAFWWQDQYKGFFRHLQDRYHCLQRNERIIAYGLREGGNPQHRRHRV
jgi:hypothetical protein